ncbi:hypothetical protein J31TS4_36170 [Paenibacillus sp. J31TS4]|uniref:SWIM zinc finger family protein n=1 Tax=Paenibacillus sp. J31TS4 TaxID=2807195 RepID=UPI001B2AB29F|nr:hypothetical protein [Paenibacillus sp. J31TS4]GIP40337.1 hypothetical protein J31TS4_36170 [Paenibacillus sp. J31TS4]
MLKVKIPKNRMTMLVEELQTRFEPETAERGWELFHKGMVRDFGLKQGLYLHARVLGKTPGEVEVNLDQFSKSECSCAADGYCAHMAAAIFQAYTAHGRPELLLIQIKHRQLTRTRNQRQQEKPAREAAGPALPIPDMPPSGWHKLFEQRFFGYTLDHHRTVDTFQEAAWAMLLPLAAQWEPGLRSLYGLHVGLFVLRRLDEFHAVHQTAYLSSYHEAGSRSAADHCLRRLAEFAAKGDGPRLRRAYPGHWDETVRLVRDWALRGKPGPAPWVDAYRMLWSRLFGSPEAIVTERRQLELRLKQAGLTPRQRDVLLHALASFEAAEGRGEEARRLLDGLQTPRFTDFAFLLEESKAAGDWGELLAWLRWLQPHLSRWKQDEFHAYCSYWMDAVQHLDDDEEWLAVMRGMLPRSYAYYSAYLMKTRRYRAWIDLQLAHGVQPHALPSAELKAVEAAAPELLLPLYHHAVERTILEKTRTSYKQAVRQLKSLYTLYGRLGQTGRWEAYLRLLSQQYARLRAFQEELKKGPWPS